MNSKLSFTIQSILSSLLCFALNKNQFVKPGLILNNSEYCKFLKFKITTCMYLSQSHFFLKRYFHCINSVLKLSYHWTWSEFKRWWRWLKLEYFGENKHFRLDDFIRDAKETVERWGLCTNENYKEVFQLITVLKPLLSSNRWSPQGAGWASCSPWAAWVSGAPAAPTWLCTLGSSGTRWEHVSRQPDIWRSVERR